MPPCLARLSLLTSLLAALPAWAQSAPRLNAGLWEHSFQVAGQGGQMAAAMKQAQAAMANMTPDQRRMMEQMMAKQGIALDATGQKVRVCLTPEDVARDELPPAQNGCTQSSQRSGNVWTVSFQCPARNGAPGSNGRGTVTLQSPNAYSGQFAINTQVGQKAEQVTMSTQGRWVSAECGVVRPVGR